MEKSKSDEFKKSLERIFKNHEISASIYVEQLSKMLMDGQADKAIDEIFKVYNRALNCAYTDDNGKNDRGYVEAVAGGPCEIIPRAVYNAVGAVYPFLNREQKKKALSEIFRILNKQNYLIVNSIHTPGIREPLLLSDIGIAVPLYWPGLYEGDRLIKKYPDFYGFKEDIIDEQGLFKTDKVESDFLVAYSLLRSDMCDYGEEYIKAADEFFLERTLQGIVARRFARTKDQNEIEKSTRRLKELLPGSVHDKIEPLRQKAEWIDYESYKYMMYLIR